MALFGDDRSEGWWEGARPFGVFSLDDEQSQGLERRGKSVVLAQRLYGLHPDVKVHSRMDDVKNGIAH
jgi:hypothetical protein